MKHVNKAILLGNVGADPKIGNGVARIRLATNRVWKDKEGVKQERTPWTTCVAFGKLADIVQNYVVKGQALHIMGYGDSREYEKEGVKREAYEIIIEDLVLLTKPGESNGNSNTSNRDSRNSSGPSRNTSNSTSNNRPSSAPAPASSGGFDDDDFADYPV